VNIAHLPYATFLFSRGLEEVIKVKGFITTALSCCFSPRFFGGLPVLTRVFFFFGGREFFRVMKYLVEFLHFGGRELSERPPRFRQSFAMEREERSIFISEPCFEPRLVNVPVVINHWSTGLCSKKSPHAGRVALSQHLLLTFTKSEFSFRL
jgi:hypothetical protein